MNPTQSPAVATILLAEDEIQLLELITLILEAEGYQVLPARDGKQALQLAAAFEGVIHVLLSDVMMPEVTGPSLARQLQAVRSNVQVILISGYTPDSFELDESWVFLYKPVYARDLLRNVAAALDRRAKSRNAVA